VFAAIASGIAVLGGSFSGFVLAAAGTGVSAAFAQQYRFAAADGGSPAFRAKSISWVLSGGIAAAIIGPQTAILTRDLFAPIPFAGAFFATAGLAVMGFLVLTFLRGEARLPPHAALRSGGRSADRPAARFIVAVLCAMGTYSMMTLVMTAPPPWSPADLEDNAASASSGTSWRCSGPSFFSGALVALFRCRSATPSASSSWGCAACPFVQHRRRSLLVAIVLLASAELGFVSATPHGNRDSSAGGGAKVRGLNDFWSSAWLRWHRSVGKLFGTVGWT
jgi:hypothetical protein